MEVSSQDALRSIAGMQKKDVPKGPLRQAVYQCRTFDRGDGVPAPGPGAMCGGLTVSSVVDGGRTVHARGADAGLAVRCERASETSLSVPPAQGVGQVPAQAEGTAVDPAPTRVSTTQVVESSSSSGTQPVSASASASGANVPDPVPAAGAVVHGLRRSSRIIDQGKGNNRSKGVGKR